ncbi:MAG TPA: MBL fold metallo-hydrolase [Polyangiaceae bacterium]|nr:MBL fold metallo-hydrolase [Polyangiaceae bacterium]
MLFRQLFDQESSTYTYLLADQASRKAVIIDPVFEQVERDATLIRELDLELLFALDTHVHADHVTGSGLLKQRLGAKTVLSERAGAVCADKLVKHGDQIVFGGSRLEIRETPGHTNGCLSYVSHESARVFTGDALLIRGSGRTDFQQGSSDLLYRSVIEQIFTLPDETEVFPGHDYKGRSSSSIAEEKRWNPRLGQGKSAQEFATIMRELKLPHPRKMDIAVPANLYCGVRPDSSRPRAEADTSFAPVVISGSGVPELGSEWVAGNAGDLTVLDVREPDEFLGELGHLPTAELVPLAALAARAASLPRERPLLTVCRSGGRSGQAALLLLQHGFTRVASLRGGMLDWSARRLPVEFGAAPSHVTNRQG